LARRVAVVVGVSMAASATAIAVRHYLATPADLESELPGRAVIDRGHGGDLYATVNGPADAPPLVLLHEFYPGASSFEYRGLMPRLAAHFQVHAVDWLGYGMSERPPLPFTGEFYASMLTGYLRDTVGRPAIVIAHGHAANIATRAASDAPELFAGLVLVAPWIDAGEQLDPTLSQTAARLAERMRLGFLPYAALTTRTVIRWLSLRRGDASASEEALDHQQASARQLGAEHAALSMLAGELDLPIQPMLPLLHVSTLIVGGERDTRVTPARLRELAHLRPHTPFVTISGAGAAAFEDQPVRFIAAIQPWLAQVSQPASAAGGTAPNGSAKGITAEPAPAAAAPPTMSTRASVERSTPLQESAPAAATPSSATAGVEDSTPSVVIVLPPEISTPEQLAAPAVPILAERSLAPEDAAAGAEVGTARHKTSTPASATSRASKPSSSKGAGATAARAKRAGAKKAMGDSPATPAAKSAAAKSAAAKTRSAKTRSAKTKVTSDESKPATPKRPRAPRKPASGTTYPAAQE
ncbi:MAG TPA: alpha/beta hydrolase, partial [Ktedonobacterales bacterium]